MYKNLSKQEILQKLFEMVQESEDIIKFYQSEGQIYTGYYHREVGRAEGLNQAIGVIKSMKED